MSSVYFVPPQASFNPEKNVVLMIDSASVNPALSLMVQHFSQDKQAHRKCQNDLMLYLSRFKRKDMKNNGRYIGNENWNNVDRHIGFVCRKYHLFIQNFSCFSHFCIFFKVLVLVLSSTLVWLLQSTSNFRHFLVPERPLSVLLPVGCWLGECTQWSHSCISPRRCMSDQGTFHHCTSESPFFGWSWFPDNMSIYVPSCLPLQNIWLKKTTKEKELEIVWDIPLPLLPITKYNQKLCACMWDYCWILPFLHYWVKYKWFLIVKMDGSSSSLRHRINADHIWSQSKMREQWATTALLHR